MILSAVAAAMAARRYMQRHLDACAVMRCLGMTHGRLLRFHATLFLWLALLAGVVGSFARFCRAFRADALADPIAGPRLAACRLVAPGGYFGVAGAVFGFAMPPLLQLARVPTLRPASRTGAATVFTVGRLPVSGRCSLRRSSSGLAGNLRLGLLAVAGFRRAARFRLIARLFHRRPDGMAGAGVGWRQGWPA